MTLFITPQVRLTTFFAGLLFSLASLLTGCGGGGETGGDPSITGTPGSGVGGSAPAAGAMASLSWSPVQDPSVFAYYVHYGRQSSQEVGSCSYESFVYVGSPSATVTDLERNTTYYFAVSAFNGVESPCSSEITTVTPSPAA